jgi:hypothetical protein
MLVLVLVLVLMLMLLMMINRAPFMLIKFMWISNNNLQIAILLQLINYN